MGRYNKWSIVAIVLTIFLSIGMMSVMADGISTTPSQSLSHQWQVATNTTPSTKVVLVVADQSNLPVIAIGDMIAAHEHAPMFITPPSELKPQIVDTLQQLMENQNVNTVFVVGLGDNASTIADMISKCSVPGVNLTVSRIIANDVYNLSLKASIFEFPVSDSAVICNPSVAKDLAEGVTISVVDDIPMIYTQLPTTEMSAFFQLLGVKSIYVTPAVTTNVLSYLNTTGYEINPGWNGLNLVDPIQSVVDAGQPVRNATLVVGTVQDYIRTLSVDGRNGSVILTNATDELGTYASDYLQTVKPGLVVLFGNYTYLSNGVGLECSAITGKPVNRIFFDNYYIGIARLALMDNGYTYPVVVVLKINKVDGKYEYIIKNIGFSDAVPYGDYAVKLVFKKQGGKFTDSSMQPIFQNDSIVIYYYNKPLYPGDYFILTFNTEPGTVFTPYPEINYNAYNLAGAVVNIQSFVGLIVQKVAQMKQWFADMFEKYFGFLKSHIPVGGIAQTIIASIITVIILWSIVGLIVYLIKWAIDRQRPENVDYYGPIVWIIDKIARR